MLGERGAALTGLGLGLGLMYFLDPACGRRRRARAKDKLTHTAHLSIDAMGAAGRDVTQRTNGLVARARGAFDRAPVDNVILVERVRSQLGRVVPHPHAIAVDATAGRVRMRGPVLRSEVGRVVRAVARVRGVRDVVNELDVHEQAGNVPGLQGGSTPSGLTPDILQRQWAPATRVLMGSSGTALLGYGASRRSLAGGLLAASGLGLLARAVTNFDPGRLVTMTRRPAMALQTSTAFSQRQAARLS